MKMYLLEKGMNMKPIKDVNSVEKALVLKNILWAFPYLGMIGLFGGYALAGPLGAIIGLMIAAVVSAMIGSAASIITGKISGGAINAFYGLGRRTFSLREQLAGDLNVVRHHKLFNRFDEALIKIEDVLAKDPDFPEALFLKAQILWQGFEDLKAARQCLLRIIKVEPDKKSLFHRWAMNLYREMSEKAQRKF
jgi:tetratricopeptide (TPR) repeat protein